MYKYFYYFWKRMQYYRQNIEFRCEILPRNNGELQWVKLVNKKFLHYVYKFRKWGCTYADSTGGEVLKNNVHNSFFNYWYVYFTLFFYTRDEMLMLIHFNINIFQNYSTDTIKCDISSCNTY